MGSLEGREDGEKFALGDVMICQQYSRMGEAMIGRKSKRDGNIRAERQNEKPRRSSLKSFS